MTYTFKLSRRIAQLRAPLFAALVIGLAAGCDETDSFNPDSAETPEAFDPSAPIDPIVMVSDDTPIEDEGPELLAPADQPAMASVSFAGGIPMGTFAQPTGTFGSRYNGGFRNIWPQFLRSELAAIKARGGKVVLMLAGHEEHYKTNGRLSVSKWKERIDRFRGVDFQSYIDDGTIIGHYLIDEPYDPVNWGEPVPGATLEEMAKYSKSIWPTFTTIVRAEPYLIDWSGTYRYLDAAWAQYLWRKGDVDAYLRRNVSEAQRMGLGLVVGLNLRHGGNPNHTLMSASEVESWGSGLLNSSYPCAFISWQYMDDYLENSSMGSAMDALRSKAENRPSRSCRGSGLGSGTPPPPPPPPPPAPEPPPIAGSLPFGLSHSPIEGYSAPWTGTMHDAEPSTLVNRLDRAASARMKSVVKLVGTASSKNSDGTFSLSRWKAQLDRYRSLPIGAHVSSRTFYLHYLVEQPRCASCWGGKAISWETIEEMARYSKSIWPVLPTTVRVAPTNLAEATFRWNHLDAGWVQYNTRQGDLRTRLAKEATRAREEGLGLVAGLNLVDGAGFNTAAMTASQVRQFGTILAADPSVCALVGWRHDQSYLGQTGMRDAMEAVAAVARGRSAASCVRQ